MFTGCSISCGAEALFSEPILMWGLVVFVNICLKGYLFSNDSGFCQKTLSVHIVADHQDDSCVRLILETVGFALVLRLIGTLL